MHGGVRALALALFIFLATAMGRMTRPWRSFVLRLVARAALLLLLVRLHPSQAFVSRHLSATRTALMNSCMFMSSSPTQKANSRLYPFVEARKIARGHGFESKQEFIDYECAGAYQLPKNPESVWSDDWRGWDDFLGVPLSFDEGRRVARTLQLASEQEYLKLMESKTMDDNELASRLPYRPDLRYKQEWQGWDDWLGNNT